MNVRCANFYFGIAIFFSAIYQTSQ